MLGLLREVLWCGLIWFGCGLVVPCVAFVVVVWWFVVLVIFVDLSFVTNCFRYCVGFGWVGLVFACILLVCVSGGCVRFGCVACGGLVVARFVGFAVFGCAVVAWFGLVLHLWFTY